MTKAKVAKMTKVTKVTKVTNVAKVLVVAVAPTQSLQNGFPHNRCLHNCGL